jgi:pilus assembly protein CpaC
MRVLNGNHPARQQSTGTFPTGAFPTGTFPTGTFPTGTFPTGTLPVGTVPGGEHRSGKHPNGGSAVGEYPTARRLTGKLLGFGVAFCVLAAPVAMTRGETPLQAPLQPPPLTRNGPPANEPATVQEQNAQSPGPQAPLGTQPAAPPPVAEIPKPFHGSVSFEAGSGKIITLTLPAANIYVADPKVAEVRPASSTSLFVFGVGAGHTTIAAVDQLGRVLADYDVTVRPSAFGAREAQAAISRLIPGSQVQVRPSGKGVMLTGAVPNATDAAQAMLIAKGFMLADAGVQNQMSIASPSQVTLMVRIAEMKRSTARNIGVNWAAAAKLGTAVGTGLVSGFAPLITGTLNGATCGAGGGRLCFDTILNALANEGLAHILAEPNLTVMSGQGASFQAGGEYPYAVPSGSNSSAVTISFKPYGVMLSFVPTVLSNGRINLHVKPEVSQLDSTNTVQIPGAGVVDGLLVRRAETTVELGSGETFAIAGMLQTTSNSNDSGLPGISDTPIIGALFKTNSMTREQTELVIIVTPILVHPVQNMAQLRIPGDGYKVPGDVDRLLRMHEVPNRDGTVAPRQPGEAGFIVR